MKNVTFLPGVALASALIGPTALIGGTVIGVALGGTGAEALWVVPLAILFALPIGFVVSILPNLLATTLLASLGRGNIAVRLPVMWALAGAGTGAALVVLISAGTADAGSMALIAMIGTVSALLCRWKTVWNDDLPRETHDGQASAYPPHQVARPRRDAADRWLH